MVVKLIKRVTIVNNVKLDVLNTRASAYVRCLRFLKVMSCARMCARVRFVRVYSCGWLLFMRIYFYFNDFLTQVSD